ALDRRHLLDRRTRLFDRGKPGFGSAALLGCELSAVARDPAMRAGADAEIVLVAPVSQVVPTFGAGPGVVGDFIGRHPGSKEPPLGNFEQRGCRVFIGRESLTALGAVTEGGAGLDRQLIERQMRSG